MPSTDLRELLKIIKKTDSSVISEIPSEHASLAAALETSSFVEGKIQLMAMDDWLSTTDIIALSQSEEINSTHSIPSPSDWIKSRQIFSLSWKGETLFPAYGLTTKNGVLRPLPDMKEVLLKINHFGDWAIAGWFASPNSFLGGKISPKDLIESDSARVIAAASDAAIGIQHG